MYSTADIHSMVETRTSVESYDVHEGNSRIPEIPGVAYLDVVSALNQAGDTLTLFCVNRKTDGGIRSKLEISNFAVASGSANELRASSVFAENNEWRPHAIRPRAAELSPAGSNFEYEFPPASVTVLALKRR
jgi:alpha-L-arabinofuranosidase